MGRSITLCPETTMAIFPSIQNQEIHMDHPVSARSTLYSYVVTSQWVIQLCVTLFACRLVDGSELAVLWDVKCAPMPHLEPRSLPFPVWIIPLIGISVSRLIQRFQTMLALTTSKVSPIWVTGRPHILGEHLEELPLATLVEMPELTTSVSK